MPRFHYIKNSLTSGELSERALGRTDLPIYGAGCKKMENMIPHPMGGAFRRIGSRYIRKSPTAMKIIPFVYSQTETYFVEICSDGVYVTTDNGSGTTPIPYGVPLYTGGELYTQADCDQMQFTQSADVLFIVTPNKRPAQLQRIGDVIGTPGFILTSYDLNGIPASYTAGSLSTLAKKIPYRDLNTIAGITMAASTITVNIGGTLTCSDSTFVFKSGQFFKLNASSITGVVYITADGTGSAAMNVLKAPFNTSATSSWEENAWNTKYGYPKAVCFFQNRLFYGGSAKDPDTFWGSKTANYLEMMGRQFEEDQAAYDPLVTYKGLGYPDDKTYRNSAPLSFQITSQQVNPINFLAARKQIILGTSQLEYLAYGGDPSTALGRLNPGGNVETYFGSRPVQPVRLNEGLVFVGKDGKRLVQFTFDYRLDSYRPDDLSIYADHMATRRSLKDGTVKSVGSSIKEIYLQGQSFIWAITDDGMLLTCTIKSQTNALGWAAHFLGGPSETAGSLAGPFVASICVVPYNGLDKIYLLVDRLVNGAVVRTVEAIDPGPVPTYLDCFMKVSSPGGTTTLTGLTHLEGLPVLVMATTSVAGVPTTTAVVTKTVISGTITLDTTAHLITLGLPFTPLIQTTIPEAGSAIGASQGAVKRIDQVSVRLAQTDYLKVGRDSSRLESIQLPNFSLAYTALGNVKFSGDKTLPFPGDYDREATVTITSDQPTALGIAAIVMRGVTYDV